MSINNQRIATGAVLALLPILGIAFQGWVLFAILFVVTALTLWEFYAMFTPAKGLGFYKIIGVIFTALLMLSLRQGSETLLVATLVAGFWAASLTFLVRYSMNPETTFHHAAIFLAGLLYIPLNFQFLLGFNRFELILIILAATVSDTAAFYAGTLFGKKKIWPSVSPKKSWMGSMGGMAGCMAVTAIFGAFFGHASLWQWLALGAALNLAAQFGDFFESALKRTLDIKDSGSILPGHGGLLDRVDSLLLVIPVYALAKGLFPFFG